MKQFTNLTIFMAVIFVLSLIFASFIGVYA